MRTTILAAALALVAGAAAADPVEGVWMTQPDDNGNYAHVTIAPCGAEICGVLGKGFDSAGSPIASQATGA